MKGSLSHSRTICALCSVVHAPQARQSISIGLRLYVLIRPDYRGVAVFEDRVFQFAAFFLVHLLFACVMARRWR